MSAHPPTLPPFPERESPQVQTPAPWTVRKQTRPAPAPRPVARLSRRYEIEWLQDGEVFSATRPALALPVFEQAFGAFAHGVIIQTTEGPVAVEDLCPGMWLEGPEGEVAQLLWKGSINLVPGASASEDAPDKLYRVMPDAFGLGQPSQDQTFGPHARRFDREPKLRASLGTDAALVPLSALADGVSVIEVMPVAPTQVYHLACDRHATILAAGLKVESYHPGPDATYSLSDEMMRQFLMFFPYIRSIGDFGRLAAPRITSEEREAVFA